MIGVARGPAPHSSLSIRVIDLPNFLAGGGVDAMREFA